MPDHSLPPADASREEVARIELGHTTVSTTVAHVLVAGFFIAILTVLLVELAGVRALREQGLSTAWSQLTNISADIRLTDSDSERSTPASWWQGLVATNRSVLASIDRFERGLEDESLLGRTLRPSAQALMTGALGAGNERVYRGHDGWLFYRPDVEYFTGPGFLEPATLSRRVASASEWEAAPQPDPRLALAEFQSGLEARGIALVVVPTPLKPSIHPERLSRRYADDRGLLQNPSYREFVETIRADGILVFDPSEVLAPARRATAQYLATDTHWRPEAMEAAAERLAAFITEHVDLPGSIDPEYRIERQEVRNTGDSVPMLDLSPDTSLYSPEAVWLRRVLRPDGSLWQSSRQADVLVLGDSFSTIYALESMGWGTSAGFVEQLSYALRRPVDRIVQNDQGAFATRAMLSRDPGRLDGKRVVVYQFAARELAFGDWRVIRLR